MDLQAHDGFSMTVAERTKRRRVDSSTMLPDLKPPSPKRRRSEITATGRKPKLNDSTQMTVRIPSAETHPDASESIAQQCSDDTPLDDTIVVVPRRRSNRHQIKVEKPCEIKIVPNQHSDAAQGGIAHQAPLAVDTDRQFAMSTKLALERGMLGRPKNVGYYNMRRIAALLGQAEPANAMEGPELNDTEARNWLAAHTHDRPIFTKDQQTIPLMSVEQILDEFYDDDAEVWVQDSVRLDYDASTRSVPIREVKQRLRLNEDPLNPWNCLELAAPVEDGTRPRYLSGEDFRLLTKIKFPTLKSMVDPTTLSRKYYEKGYKEAEKWMLIAQAGALTNPHQDSHGHATYITINEGIVGFGWLHCPTELQRRSWRKAPHSFSDGTWRYRILRPGDTVYFPAGQVHFVFRNRDYGHTLCFGGHVLRCSTIVHWIKTMREQIESDMITNEEWSSSANGYVRQVATFVQQALESGDKVAIGKWGGADAIEEFLDLKKKLEASTLVKRPRNAKKQAVYDAAIALEIMRQDV